MAGSNGILKYARVNREDQLINPKFRGLTYQTDDWTKITGATNPNPTTLTATQILTPIYFDNSTVNPISGPTQAQLYAQQLLNNQVQIGAGVILSFTNNGAATQDITMPGWPISPIVVLPMSTTEVQVTLTSINPPTYLEQYVEYGGITTGFPHKILSTTHIDTFVSTPVNQDVLVFSTIDNLWNGSMSGYTAGEGLGLGFSGHLGVSSAGTIIGDIAATNIYGQVACYISIANPAIDSVATLLVVKPVQPAVFVAGGMYNIESDITYPNAGSFGESACCYASEVDLSSVDPVLTGGAGAYHLNMFVNGAQQAYISRTGYTRISCRSGTTGAVSRLATGELDVPPSSKNLKNNIKYLDSNHSKFLYDLKPALFNYKQDPTEKPRAGFILEDMIQGSADSSCWEYEHDQKTYKLIKPVAIDYNSVLSHCVNEIQHLNQRILKLENPDVHVESDNPHSIKFK